MSTRTVTLEGHYYNGNQPIAVPASMVFEGGVAELKAGDISEQCSVDTLKVTPQIGRADRFITMSSGGQFQCANDPFLDSLPQESPSEGFVEWLEARWGMALAGAVITVSLLLAGYFYGLPAIAERVAGRIPMETEQSIGRQALAWLDNNKWFKPTHLEQDTRSQILKGFDELRADLPLKRYDQLEFRDSEYIGPNAIAMPGGTIVITDQMVKLTETQEEVLAVLAHELGHIELRHAMKHVMQDSVIAVAVTTVTADAASLSVAVAGLPALLAQAKYSRKFETEADDFAFRLLKQRNHSPAAFASLMERLAKKHEEKEHAFAFVSTHPITSERIDRARAAAEK
jgi:hypothetical protein